MADKEVFIKCACGSEGLLLSYWKDDKEVYISKLRHAPGSTTLKWRLKAAWDTLVSGEPYKDEILLGEDQVAELQLFLKRIQEQVD